MSTPTSLSPAVGASAGVPVRWYASRWTQLVVGIVCMIATANIQYAWTLFVPEIQKSFGWERASIQIAFTIFVLVQTWLAPIEGYFIDKFGPRLIVAFGALFIGAAWVINSQATTLLGFYIGAAVGGIGVGSIYATCINNALKWFPDRRGLAAGLTAAGFGAGAALTVIPIANMIQTSGYEHTFLYFGILQGACIFVMAMFMVKPFVPKGVVAQTRLVMTKVDYTPAGMVKTPVFWLTYLLFVLVAAGGLMATAEIGPIAKDYHIDKLPMHFLGLSMPLLTMTLAIDNLANGFTRPLCGFVSDKIGRENTMLIVFIGEGLALLGLRQYGHEPVAFMTFAALVFLFWGEIYSIFPALVADTFGIKNAAGNAGTMYTAKGTASLFVPLGTVLAAGGNWDRVFLLVAVVSIGSGIAAKLVLAPLRRRTIEAANAAAAARN